MLSGRLDLKPCEKKLLPIFEKSHLAWPKFAEELENKSGKSIGYKKEGTLRVACDLDEEKKLKNNYDFLKNNKVNIYWLSGDKIRDKEPYVSNNVLSGFFFCNCINRRVIEEIFPLAMEMSTMGKRGFCNEISTTVKYFP